jgi:hypothetical protein
MHGNITPSTPKPAPCKAKPEYAVTGHEELDVDQAEKPDNQLLTTTTECNLQLSKDETCSQPSK